MPDSIVDVLQPIVDDICIRYHHIACNRPLLLPVELLFLMSCKFCFCQSQDNAAEGPGTGLARCSEVYPPFLVFLFTSLVLLFADTVICLFGSAFTEQKLSPPDVQRAVMEAAICILYVYLLMLCFVFCS